MKTEFMKKGERKNRRTRINRFVNLRIQASLKAGGERCRLKEWKKETFQQLESPVANFFLKS